MKFFILVKRGEDFHEVLGHTRRPGGGAPSPTGTAADPQSSTGSGSAASMSNSPPAAQAAHNEYFAAQPI